MLVPLLILGLSSFAFASSRREDATNKLDTAAQVLHEIMSAPDKGIPQEVLASAKCMVIIPHVIKGAFVFGGEHGEGACTCRLSKGSWSAPAFVNLSGGSWGLQIGGSSTDVIMMVMTESGAEKLMNAQFKIGADASAAAGPVGRHASAGTDWKLNTELLTYSRSKGLFAGIDLSGAVAQEDHGLTIGLYGKDVGFRNPLIGEVPVPQVAAAQNFLRAVANAKEFADKNK